MNGAPPPVVYKCGDYALRRPDTEQARADARNQLIQNGCRSFRDEPNGDGTVTVHGYLRG